MLIVQSLKLYTIHQMTSMISILNTIRDVNNRSYFSALSEIALLKISSDLLSQTITFILGYTF